MTRARSWVAVSVALAAAAATAPIPAQGTPLVVVHMDFDAWNSGFPQSGLAQAWREPAVAALRDRLDQQMAETGAPSLASLGELMSGQAAFVVMMETTPPEVTTGFAIHQPGRAGELASQLPALFGPAAAEASAMMLHEGDVVAFGENPQVRSLLTQLLPQGPQGLAITPREGSFLNARINIAPMIGQFAPPDVESVRALVFGAGGLGNVHALELSSGFAGAGMDYDVDLTFHGERTGLMNFLGENGEFTVLDLVPPDVTDLGAIRLAPLDQMFTQIQQSLIASGDPEMAQQIQAMTMMAQMQMGVDPASLFGAIGPEIAFARGPGDGGAAIIQVSNRPVIEGVVNQMTAMAQMMSGMADPNAAPTGPQSVTESGVTYQVMDMMFAQVCLGFVGDNLVISNAQPMMSRVIQASSSGQSIRQAPDYQTMAAQMNLPAAGVSYSDAQASADELSTMLDMMMAPGMGLPAEEQEPLRAAVQAVARHLGQSGGTIHGAPDRISFHGHSTSGVESLMGAVIVPAFIAVPNYFEAQDRAQVSRVRSDMRSMATALESFFIDNNRYPVSTIGANPMSLSQGDPSLMNMPTFSLQESMSTPIAYITHHMEDSFNPTGGTFSYHADGSGWILLSPGTDGDFDIDPRAFEGRLNYSAAQPDILLQTFDPTNGTVSNGDILRLRQ